MDRCIVHRLSYLIKWPDRAELIATMPLSFLKYFGTKLAVIIYYSEDFVNKSSNCMARACTWSQYKHRNTIKYLIGISQKESYHLYQKLGEVK